MGARGVIDMIDEIGRVADHFGVAIWKRVLVRSTSSSPKEKNKHVKSISYGFTHFWNHF